MYIDDREWDKIQTLIGRAQATLESNAYRLREIADTITNVGLFVAAVLKNGEEKGNLTKTQTDALYSALCYLTEEPRWLVEIMVTRVKPTAFWSRPKALPPPKDDNG